MLRSVNPSSPRALAVQVLRRREETSEYTEDLLTEESGRNPLAPADRSLAQELIYGVVRWQATLDWLIQRKTPPGRNQKSILRILLRLGMYQLFWLNRIPDHAAVHETVALAKSLGFGPQAGFVNAVLRAYIRERESTVQLLREAKADKPALGYSHPDWIFTRWDARWGRERAVWLLDWNNTPPKTYARLNALRTNPATLTATWLREQVGFVPVEGDWFESGCMFELGAHPPLSELDSFRLGLFYVQDPSTLLAVEQLDPHPGHRVLDLCAAPGGKCTYLAQLMHNRGEVVACEYQAHRLTMLRANCERLGATCVTTTEGLETRPESEARQQFDRVLVDAPCSNSGVMRRRVDLRWRIRPEEIERLRATQRRLLEQAAGHVAPGGILVYSTCSLEPEENGAVVRSWLETHREFLLEQERELLPFNEGFDGAYVARLVRTAGERAGLQPKENLALIKETHDQQRQADGHNGQ